MFLVLYFVKPKHQAYLMFVARGVRVRMPKTSLRRVKCKLRY